MVYIHYVNHLIYEQPPFNKRESMELGSPEHKQLLTKSIVRVAVKTAFMGFIAGFFFMIPSFFRENAFSSGLFYLGTGIVITTLAYATWVAYQKYQRIVKPFIVKE